MEIGIELLDSGLGKLLDREDAIGRARERHAKGDSVVRSPETDEGLTDMTLPARASRESADAREIH